MALNFPPVDSADGNPTNGMIWTAPNGRQWMYDSTIPGWKSLCATGNSNIIYRGGLDLTQDPFGQYATIESGNQFAVTVGADPVNGTLYPGLDGKAVQEGSVVLYDGNEWQMVSGIPYASTAAPGVVQLATCDESYDGINNKKALTPSTGKCLYKQAAIDEVGITRYATRNEAEAGVETEAALTPYSIRNLLDSIVATVGNLVPTGMIMWWTDDRNIPTGWIKCDGSAIAATGSTAKLYQLLEANDNHFGNGSTVRVPDLRGRFIRGYNDGSGRDPADPPFGSAQNDQFENHNHTVIDPGHAHVLQGYVYRDDQNADRERNIIDDDYTGSVQTDSQAVQESSTGIKLEPTGGVETRPKNINLTAVIKL